MKRLPPKDQARVRTAIAEITSGPGQGDLIKLHGKRDEWRLRVGDWRVRLGLDTAARTIVVLHVLPRGSAYRD
ncbi:MAG: type II toxin-antitoxin system RelE/ParE family toxin [Planctomycetes bacterium]|nr:type II toxin-antitoxin system RelE/ParE family toxin [Planctomycetota bacterium]